MALSQSEVLAGLAEIVNEETGIATEAVQLDKSFTDDLDIDSISMMTIVVNAEDKFGVKIPDEEVKKWLARDPIVTFRTKLLNDRAISAEQLAALEKKTETEITEAVRFAEESPWPEPDALFSEVYG